MTALKLPDMRSLHNKKRLRSIDFKGEGMTAQHKPSHRLTKSFNLFGVDLLLIVYVHIRRSPKVLKNINPLLINGENTNYH